jgi:hypothetical protein
MLSTPVSRKQDNRRLLRSWERAYARYRLLLLEYELSEPKLRSVYGAWPPRPDDLKAALALDRAERLMHLAWDRYWECTSSALPPEPDPLIEELED